MRLRSARWAVAMVLACGTGLAQESGSLTLQRAVAIALEKNPTRKAALADVNAASAGIQEARSAVWPRLMFSETAVRGNDPVYVFGAKLRQQRFALSDFDLNRLNRPLPFGNFSTRLGATWNLFDSMASWKGIRRAELMKEAASRQLDRTNQELVYRVVDAYYAVLLARKQSEVAEQAVKTAQAILDRSRARYESGLSVEADLLSAQVRMASRQQEAIRAKNNFDLARAQLDVVMGIPFGTASEPAEVLAEQSPVIAPLDVLEKQALEKRPDLERVRSEEAAQEQSVSIAKSSFGPRVNAFAGWQMDNPTLFAGGGGNNWTGGLEVQFDLFTGGAKKAQLSRERALQEKMAAFKQAASDGIRLDVRRAYYELDSARKEVEVSRGAVTQAQESLRIYQNRYEAGLLAIADLLTAEDAARQAQTSYWESVYRLATSFASLELATGTLTAQSPVVQP